MGTAKAKTKWLSFFTNGDIFLFQNKRVLLRGEKYGLLGAAPHETDQLW